MEWRDERRYPATERTRSVDRLPFLFLMVLALGVTLWAFIGAAQSGLCTTEEKEFAVCLRNWINAAGNIFAFVAAATAAYFAFRQAGEARRQANVARLPNVESQLKILYQLQDIAFRASVSIRRVLDVARYVLADSNDFTDDDRRNAQNLVAAKDVLFLRKIKDDLEVIDLSSAAAMGYGSLSSGFVEAAAAVRDSLRPFATLAKAVEAASGDERVLVVPNTEAYIERIRKEYMSALPILEEYEDEFKIFHFFIVEKAEKLERFRLEATS